MQGQETGAQAVAIAVIYFNKADLSIEAIARGAFHEPERADSIRHRFLGERSLSAARDIKKPGCQHIGIPVGVTFFQQAPPRER